MAQASIIDIGHLSLEEGEPISMLHKPLLATSMTTFVTKLKAN